MAEPPTFGRYAEIPVERMTAEQQAGYHALVDGPRGRLPGPYRVWVHNPRLVHAIAPLGTQQHQSDVCAVWLCGETESSQSSRVLLSPVWL